MSLNIHPRLYALVNSKASLKPSMYRTSRATNVPFGFHRPSWTPNGKPHTVLLAVAQEAARLGPLVLAEQLTLNAT